MNWDNLRRSGPGKFEGGFKADAFVYADSLDGCDEEIGDAEATGWHGLIRGTIGVPPEFGDANDDERDYLAAAAGFIVTVDAQGFVTVDRHETEAELMDAWRTCEADVEEQCDA